MIFLHSLTSLLQAYLGALIFFKAYQCTSSYRCVEVPRSRHTNFYERFAYFPVGGLRRLVLQDLQNTTALKYPEAVIPALSLLPYRRLTWGVGWFFKKISAFCDGTRRYGVPAPFFAKYMFFSFFNVYGPHYSCTPSCALNHKLFIVLNAW